jgi:hypothetical protein
MKSERDIHCAIFGTTSAETEMTPSAPAQQMTDDELFDDALI